jgi:uncharacterized membrane protein
LTNSLDQAKILGGIGSILTLLGLVPVYGTALVVIGWILVLFAIYQISDAVKDKSIFNNGLVASVLSIAGSVGLNFVGISIIFGSLGRLFSSNPVAAINTVLSWLVLLWVSAMISSVFLYMSFKKVSTKLNVGLFSTSALIYVIGEGLTIVLVGFVISFVAQILFAVSFFSLPERAPVSVSLSAPSSSSSYVSPSQTGPVPIGSGSVAGMTTQVLGERKFCPKCGAKLDLGASFCAYCGARTNTSS